MKYAHVLMAVAAEIWAMQPEKLAAVIELLAHQAAGEKFTAEEIEAKIAPATARAVARREGVVAVIPVRGVIANRMPMMTNISGGGGSSNEALAASLRQARDDAEVKAIVLDVDSPGGAVSGTDEVSALVHSMRGGGKPVIAQVNSAAASAAYWIASAADEIVVTPSGMVGSIGVYTVHDDITSQLEKIGVKKTFIGAGKFKGEQAPFMPLSDEALAHVQSQVDAYYGMFVDRVASNRGASSQAVRDGFGQGRMVLAREAVAAGMADSIATLEETLARFGVGAQPAPAPRARSLASRRNQAALAAAQAAL